MKPCRFSLVLVVLLVSITILAPAASEQAALAQLTAIENRIPKSVPLKVEFKNYEGENWWRDLEIEVTNTGNKPIYYLWLILWLDVKVPESDRQQAISFKFGDVKRFNSDNNGELARAEDDAIRPDDSRKFKVDAGTVKYWEMLKEREGFVEPKIAVFEHSFTNFGDGTGILAGGTHFQQKKNDIRKLF